MKVADAEKAALAQSQCGDAFRISSVIRPRVFLPKQCQKYRSVYKTDLYLLGCLGRVKVVAKFRIIAKFHIIDIVIWGHS